MDVEDIVGKTLLEYLVRTDRDAAKLVFLGFSHDQLVDLSSSSPELEALLDYEFWKLKVFSECKMTKEEIGVSTKLLKYGERRYNKRGTVLGNYSTTDSCAKKVEGFFIVCCQRKELQYIRIIVKMYHYIVNIDIIAKTLVAFMSSRKFKK